MTMTPELQPDELEVLQAEQLGPAPMVRVDVGHVSVPVRVQDLPHKSGATFNKTVGTTPVRLLSSDHRRAVARVMSVGQNVYIGFSNAMSQDTSRMVLWPANSVFTMNHDGELWVAAATATTTVSVAVESWAAGE
jgi:hypothetical protein